MEIWKRLNHHKENLLVDLDERKRLRNKVVNRVSYMCYLSKIEPKKVEEALNDDNWVDANLEELHQFTLPPIDLARA